jgi:hypothetical protein
VPGCTAIVPSLPTTFSKRLENLSTSGCPFTAYTANGSGDSANLVRTLVKPCGTQPMPSDSMVLFLTS